MKVKLTKEEIKVKICAAFSYFASRLYDAVIDDCSVPNEKIFKEEPKKVFNNCDISELKNFTKKDVLTTPGLGIFAENEDKISVTATPTFISLLPDDFVLENIVGFESGQSSKVSELKFNKLETRFGFTGYGFNIKKHTFKRFINANINKSMITEALGDKPFKFNSNDKPHIVVVEYGDSFAMNEYNGAKPERVYDDIDVQWIPEEGLRVKFKIKDKLQEHSLSFEDIRKCEYRNGGLIENYKLLTISNSYVRVLINAFYLRKTLQND